MFLSNAAMKPAGLSSERADVIEANRSTTAACVSAKPSAAAVIATMTRLRAIAGIDFDVLLREITGPETGLAFPATLNVEADLTIALIQSLFQFGLGKIGSQSAPADRDALHLDVDVLRVELDSGVTRSREDAPPVGIGSGNGRLHQRRIGDGACDALGVVFVLSAAHLNGNELSRALAVPHNLLGEVLHHKAECFAYLLTLVIVRSESRCSIGEQQYDVVRRGVTVDADAVVAVLDR